MSFLPDNYEVPTGGGGDYTKLQAGDNRLRVLSKQPVIGFEYWNEAGKPVRVKVKPVGKPADMRKTAPNGGEERVKEFWAMVVYNLLTQKIEVWQVTQAGIKEAIQSYSLNTKYGHPSNYDLTISKKGSGLETKYSVVADPPEKLAKAVVDQAKATPINLEALFEGGNPFEAAGAAPAPAPKPAPVKQPEPVAAGAPDDDNDLPF
ncbi:MAG: hypothetical protein ACRYFX_29210 [Janthinobacterium lividum]